MGDRPRVSNGHCRRCRLQADVGGRRDEGDGGEDEQQRRVLRDLESRRGPAADFTHEWIARGKMEIAGDDAMEQRHEQTDADRFHECDADRDGGRNHQMQWPDPRVHEEIPQQRQCRAKARGCRFGNSRRGCGGRFAPSFVRAVSPRLPGAHREIEYYMPVDSPLGRCYLFIRREAVRGYFTSQAGLKELDYKGNAFYGACPGCESKGV